MTFPPPARTDALRELLRLLAHPYPRVRMKVAKEFFVTLCAQVRARQMLNTRALRPEPLCNAPCFAF